jgi:hypothetical protein
MQHDPDKDRKNADNDHQDANKRCPDCKFHCPHIHAHHPERAGVPAGFISDAWSSTIQISCEKPDHAQG